MKLSHAALALALSSSLVLSACTDADDPEGTEAASSTTAAGGSEDSASATGGAGDGAVSTGDAATATGDAATSTDDGAITAPAAGAGVISVEEAETVAAQLMRTAANSQVVDVEEAAALNEKAFVGSELKAATAATTLREAGLSPVIDYAPTGSNVLAISREDGESPAFMVVQSVPESGLPELHLMVSEDDGANWKIGWSAPMLAGTKVGTFDSRSEGSTVLRDTRGDLSNYPSGVVDKLFEILDYPFSEERPDFKTNDYGPQVRKATEAQAASVSEQATMTSTHSLRTGTLRTIELADGSAIMFPVLERTSIFDVKDGMILKPPTAFIHLTGDDTITDSAKMTSLVFLAVHIRTDGGAPEVIAAREQVVSASGR